MRLTAIYDLGIAPLTFDFFSWLMVVDIYRQEAGLSGIHVIVIPSMNPGGFKPGGKPLDLATKQWRLHNLLAPICQLFGASYTLATSRDELSNHRAPALFPPEGHEKDAWWSPAILIHMFNQGKKLPKIAPSPLASRWIEHRVSKDYVTVTVRHTWPPTRNSDVEVWDRFIKWLIAKGENVIIIPDTDDAILGETVGAIGAINLPFRHALYVHAKMNIGVNNGPLWLCGFTDLPCLIFRLVDEAWAPCRAENFELMGWPVGSQLPWFHARQRLVWENESFPRLCEEYDSIMKASVAA